MTRRLLQLLGLLLLAGFVYLNVDYWRDPVYWRRWWDIVTHLEPDYMNFSPTAALGSGRPVALPRAAAAGRSISTEALAAARDYAAAFDSFALEVVQAGRVQDEWYAPGWSPQRLTQSQSMMKTITGLMVGIAIADGHIASVNDPVGRYIEEWRDDPRGAITIENLLQMSSGLGHYRFTLNPFARDSAFRFLNASDRTAVVLRTPLEWAPGSRFDYNDVDAQLAGIVVERASGQPYAGYLQARLWGPMGGQHAEVWLDREGGSVMTACCMLASPRDWAKIGLLMKDRGRFNERQIVPAAWVDAMLAPSPAYAGYGYFTWLAAGMGDRAADPADESWQSEPMLAEDLFILQGHGGQRVYVSRAQDLVIVRLGPFSGFQPLRPGWDNSFLPNTLIRGLKK